MDLGLDGKVIVCTGAAGGIGWPTARLLAAEGAKLMLVDRDGDALAAVAASLPGSHASLTVDLGDPVAAEEVAARTEEELGRIDGLIHLAAVLAPRNLDEVDVELWDLHQDVNVRGSFLVARAIAAAMASSGRGGHIVLTSSGAWLTGGMSDRLPYAVTKGAVTTLVRGLAKAFGPAGVTVNGIAPGMVETEMMRDGLTDTTRAQLETQIPLGRFARPEEIAGPIAFLLSDPARYISGSTLVISGGLILH